MPGEDCWVYGGEEQDVPRQSATMDGSLTGTPWNTAGKPLALRADGIGAGRITDLVHRITANEKDRPKLLA